MYFVREMSKEAWISIGSYKMRSFLTILGIIIGIASVVVMVSIGEGVQKQVDAQFSGLGSNLISIRPGAPRTRAVSSGNVQNLTYEDADAISKMSTVEKVAYAKSGSGQAVYSNNNYTVTIYGVSENYFSVQNLKLDDGVFFNARDIHAGSPFAIIGANVKDALYKEANPIGKIIRVRNIPFKVIGLIKEQGSGFGASKDDMVILPFNTFLKRVSGSKFPKSVSEISLNVKDDKYLDYAEEKITELLRERHKLKSKQDDDFRIMNLKELADTIKSTTEMFSILLASIAAISLIVGSIGIMNMMLVSVTERTKEIGLRKAVGAKEKTIMQQFLFEALLISFLGSMAGLLIGLTLTQVAAVFLGMDLPFSISAIVLSIIVSIVVGIASGIAPALKAAKLHPIDALRYE
jgi:putative ABC transport system permease protein